MKTNVFECHLNFDDLDIDMSEPTDTEPTYLVESPDRVAKIWCCLDRSVGFILPLLFYPLLSSRLNGLLQNTRSPPSSLLEKKKKKTVLLTTNASDLVPQETRVRLHPAFFR